MTREQILEIARPILFNSKMIQAIMDNRKTQTRRIIKPQPKGNAALLSECAGAYCFDDGTVARTRFSMGDYLYVRERFREFNCMVYSLIGGAYIPAYDFSGIEYFADFSKYRTDKGNWGELFIPADNIKQDRTYKEWTRETWRPSIHMPKAAARTFLRVTGVKAERLQNIDENDAKAEGANFGIWWEEKMSRSAIDRFADIWNSTVKKSDLPLYGWDANPWVWVYQFEKVEWCDEDH